MATLIEEKLQDFVDGLDRLHVFNQWHEEVFGSPRFDPNSLDQIGRYISTLDQDTSADVWDQIEQDIANAVIEATNVLDYYYTQADPDAPPIGDIRTPEDDDVDSNDIEPHYPHPIKEFAKLIGPAMGGVSSVSDKEVRFKDGTVIQLPKKSLGPQSVESGDNPDSYKKQDAYIGELLTQAVAPVYHDAAQQIARMEALSQWQEAQLVQSLANDWINSLKDPVMQRGARAKMQGVQTMQAFEAARDDFERTVQGMFGDKVLKQSRGIGFNVNYGYDHDAPLLERAPRDMDEMVEKLVQEVDRDYQLSKVLVPASRAKDGYLLQSVTEADEVVIRDRDGHEGLAFHSPAGGLRRLLQTMIRTNPVAAQRYLAFEQGRLEQALPAGGIGMGDVAAAQPFIFPIISRVYPMLLLTRIASVYPMDRPDGRLFYWDDLGYKYDDTPEWRLHEIDKFDTSLVEDPGEAEAASLLKFELTSVTVSATKRKLRANWSIEVEQDLRAYHNREVLNEVLTKMADQIARTLNVEALSAMVEASADREVTFGTVAPDGYTQAEWNDQILGFVHRASSEIFKRRYIEAAFIIGDPASVDRLARGMRHGVVQRSKDEWRMMSGVQVVGSLNDLYTVIKVPTWGIADMENRLLLVARGERFSDIGIAYMPYTYEVVPMLTRPDTFDKSIGIMERSALQVVIPEMFAAVLMDVGTTGVDW